MGNTIIHDYAYYRQAILDSEPDMIGYIINRAGRRKDVYLEKDACQYPVAA